MELLGDPLTLFNNLGTGVADFFLKTRSEMIGNSKTKGEGVKRLVHAILNGTLASASKITGSLEEIVRNATGLEENESDGLFESRQQHTSSFKGGLRHGGDVFVNSVISGFSGLVECPSDGFEKSGLPGVMTGTIKGLVGLVAAPVTGALGAVSVVTETVRQSTQFTNGRPVGRRRATRRIVSLNYVETKQLESQSEEKLPRILDSDWSATSISS